MASYNIQQESTLGVSGRLLGGPGYRFVGQLQDSHMHTYCWPKDARVWNDCYPKHGIERMQSKTSCEGEPKWCFAAPGLCIEGYCRNAACAAKDNIIICNKGFGKFDMVAEAEHIRCPSCEARVLPKTCAFNDCEWRYTGVKMTGGTRVYRSLDWTKTEGKYERFMSEGGGNGDWGRLLLFTRHPLHNTNGRECQVCLLGFSISAVDQAADPEIETKCGHRFHDSCLKAWQKLGKKKCPMCTFDL